MKQYPPPEKTDKIEANCQKKKIRSSNLELYRIIVMLLIVAHHYVVNSGLIEMIMEEPLNVSSSLMIIFGGWGKTGINCFVLITGYFMCKSNFTSTKLLKLYLQILFYTIIIYTIFCISDHEKLTALNIIKTIWPIKSISDRFTSCFLLFYLFIPFLNVFIQNLSKKSHFRLVMLMLLVFSILPSIPGIYISFNYVSWFVVLYFVGAYIRIYGINDKISHSGWGWISLALIVMASISILGLTCLYKLHYIGKIFPYYFIHDSNKILSLGIAVASFMYFKNLPIPHSRLINAIGGATFGVLLIHANSDAMRTWLWRETIDCMGNYSEDAVWTLAYAVGCVLVIFFVCAGIEWFRAKFIEPHLLNGVDKLFHIAKNKVCKLGKNTI